MPETIDPFFLRPRELFSAKRVYIFDAINLVAYAKLPLKTSLRGRALIAGYVHCDTKGNVQKSIPLGGQQDLLLRYGAYIDALTYPITPLQYEQLLDRMGRAGEKALPYFFQDHHLAVDRRRRSAMFARLYKELQRLVAEGTVRLQLTESEPTSVLGSDAWMTQKTLQKYLDINGVEPWWEQEANLQSHAFLERILLSDWLSVPLQILSQPEPANSLTVPATNIGGYPPVGHTAHVGGGTRSVAEKELTTDSPASDASGESEQSDVRTALKAVGLAQSRRATPQGTDRENTPEPVNLSSEAVLPLISAEHEQYDEGQLPSLLLAEKISKHSRFLRAAPQVQESSSLSADEAIAPLPGITANAATSGLRMEAIAAVAPAAMQGPKTLQVASSKRPPAGEMTNPANAAQPSTEASLGHASAELPDDEMLTKKQVALFLKLSTGTIDNYRKRPDFPKARVYGPTTIRWKRSEIREWRERNPAL